VPNVRNGSCRPNLLESGMGGKRTLASIASGDETRIVSPVSLLFSLRGQDGVDSYRTCNDDGSARGRMSHYVGRPIVRDDAAGK
jgi:hypothetical protein